tara:strand:- start:1599 stop:1778 length:180 start_codon:yes stop_codon:yes gene_type:complete
MENIKLTDLWQDGRYSEVASHIVDSKEFLEKDRLMDFCIYFNKYIGERDLLILKKLISD